MSIRNATETEKLAWRIMVHIIPSFNKRWKAYNINFDYISEDNKFITVSFNVKGFHGWKFGMWIDIEKDYGLSLETIIDTYGKGETRK